jgi:hypothetical protein
MDFTPKKTLLEKQEIKFFVFTFQIQTNQDSQGGTG